MELEDLGFRSTLFVLQSNESNSDIKQITGREGGLAPAVLWCSRFESHQGSGGKPTFPTCYYLKLIVAD